MCLGGRIGTLICHSVVKGGHMCHKKKSCTALGDEPLFASSTIVSFNLLEDVKQLHTLSSPGIKTNFVPNLFW